MGEVLTVSVHRPTETLSLCAFLQSSDKFSWASHAAGAACTYTDTGACPSTSAFPLSFVSLSLSFVWYISDHLAASAVSLLFFYLFLLGAILPVYQIYRYRRLPVHLCCVSL